MKGFVNQMTKNDNGLTVVVACRVMEPEFEKVLDGNRNVEIRYLDQGLHRTPQKLPPLIQEQIDQVAGYADRVVLGYGLCSNGIVGVVPGRQGLIVPCCHDCIAFFLGSPEVHARIFKDRPGTYFLTPGWVAEKKDPLGIVEEDYTPRHGRETSVWVMQEELKHYTHIALINTGVGNIEEVRERALENARFFEKEYEEIPGSLDYFKKVIWGPYEKKDFIVVSPENKITQEMFFET